MIIAIKGKKIGMTRFFNEDGECMPVTIIKVFDGIINQIMYKSTHGYNAVQINSNVYCNLIKNFLTEYRIFNCNKFTINSRIDLNIFSINEKIFIRGKTIGKGNAGNIKKNHFKRGPMTHGSKHHRLQGSLGAGTTPSRVFPGKKMAGRLGFQNQTIKNLEILEIDYKNNYIFIKGSVPGKFGNKLDLIKNYERINI